MSWIDRLRQSRKLDRKRKKRLRQKVQKAEVVDSLAEVESARSWNKKFHTVQSLKGGKVG